MAYQPPKGADVQGVTKFTTKTTDKMIAQADRDMKTLGANKGTRDLSFVLDQDGNPCEDNRAGRPAALPKKGR